MGTKLNMPLPPQANDDQFMQAWTEVETFIREARPEIILLQAGADSLAGDPITHLQFTSQAHGHAATRLCAIADEYCQGRLIAMGGGGYNRRNLALAWSAVVAAMASSTS